ncbi:23S rRNA (guanosine(2251)-2'-O)-methyltransferase RlmB [Candidatus Profftia tarda]|nr:23S rRNA (guanosine(2251)-2'-O)-methyltransferase RlmB [Candidatus Profftia tarda]
MNQIIYGIHSIQTLLTCEPHRFLEVFVMHGHKDRNLMLLIAKLEKIGIVVQLAHRRWLNKEAASGVHQGIIARVLQGREYQEKNLPSLLKQSKNPPLLLILDGVTDPHNLGACLRSADAAAVDMVIIPKDRSAQLNATAKKIACGAAETVPLIPVTNLARTMRYLQDHKVWIFGTVIEANKSLYQINITSQIALALVMGSEGNGLRRLTRAHCDELIRIPMAGSLASLNVSVATGICLFELVRQRSQFSCKDLTINVE